MGCLRREDGGLPAEDLETDIAEGEHTRAELFGHGESGPEDAAGKVTAWLRSVTDSFTPVSELRNMPTSDRPPGMWVTYQGLSEDGSKPVWGLDRRLEELGPVLG